jgi:hypothetical protein
MAITSVYGGRIYYCLASYSFSFLLSDAGHNIHHAKLEFEQPMSECEKDSF